MHMYESTDKRGLWSNKASIVYHIVLDSNHAVRRYRVYLIHDKLNNNTQRFELVFK